MARSVGEAPRYPERVFGKEGGQVVEESKAAISIPYYMNDEHEQLQYAV